MGFGHIYVLSYLVMEVFDPYIHQDSYIISIYLRVLGFKTRTFCLFLEFSDWAISQFDVNLGIDWKIDGGNWAE